MQEQTWTFVDKTAWGPGPWQGEPDKQQFTDEATGLPCIVRRGPAGVWCGYVGVAEGHPLFKVGYSDCPQGCDDSWCEHRPEAILDVHGGITFSDLCHEDTQPYGICHIPEPGEPDHVWWFGFDHGHMDDYMPAYACLISRQFRTWHADETYKDLAYARAQCAKLAAQLHPEDTRLVAERERQD